MTALSLAATQRLRPARPQARRRPVAAPPKAPVGRGSHLAGQATRRADAASPPRRVGSAAGVRRVARPEVGHLRLTRRGRLLITTLLFAVGVAITMFSGTVSLAGTDVQHSPVHYVTVAPGDTLWSIAGEAAPGVDRRDTVHRIVELNALAGPELSVGQRVAVPVKG